MRHEKSKTPRKRERDCRDRLHARLLEARRRHRGNPAASAAAQLVALFAVVFGRVPLTLPTQTRYVGPPISPAWAERKAVAERLGVPARYLDIVLRSGNVPYSVLFHHIRDGGVLRRDAMRVLSRRAPEASIDWLDHVESEDRWSDLLACFVRSNDEEDTDVRLLKSALAWTQSANAAAAPPGPADAGLVLVPGGATGPDDNPRPPKP